MIPVLKTKNSTGEWVMCDYLKASPSEIDTNTLSLCSGVRDSNGVMIWEGDIVSVQNTYCGFDAPKRYYVVRWREDAAALVYTDNEQYYYNSLNGWSEHCIVLVEGNMWDNPELLALIPTAEEHTAELNEAINKALAEMPETAELNEALDKTFDEMSARPHTMDELKKKYPEPREEMSEERERELVADLFDLYEAEGFAKVWWNSSYACDYQWLSGRQFTVEGRVSEEECDLEDLPMWEIRFGADGECKALDAEPTEIIPSEMRNAGCPEIFLTR